MSNYIGANDDRQASIETIYNPCGLCTETATVTVRMYRNSVNRTKKINLCDDCLNAIKRS